MLIFFAWLLTVVWLKGTSQHSTKDNVDYVFVVLELIVGQVSLSLTGLVAHISIIPRES